MFTIVNEQDEVIGHKQREEILQDDIYRVAALWLKNSNGDVLLARRAYTKSHDPGKWGPAVAGTVEEGETYEQNIYKEAEEELGLVGALLKEASKDRRSGKHNYFAQWFYAVVDKPVEEFNIQEDEVAEIKWFSRDELRRMVKEGPEDFLTSVRERVETEE